MKKLLEKGIMAILAIVLICGVVIGSRAVCIKSKAAESNTSATTSLSNKKDEFLREQKSKKLARQAVKDMYNKKFDRVCSLFCEDVPLKESDLEDVYNNMLFYTKYKKIKNTTYEVNDEYLSVSMKVECKDEYLDWVVSFNYDYKIIGFQINPYIADKLNLKNTKDFTEKKVKVGEYNLTGILTLPKNAKKAPVVIIVSGSGPTSANGTFLMNRPYADIAYNLAKQGIATLRYNDRYYERVDLYTPSDTIYEEAIDDASAAIKKLSKDSRIDNENIYVVGHSLGGMLAPKIAELNPEVKGIISLAGSLRKHIDISYEQKCKFVDLDTTLTNQEKQEKLNTLEKEYKEINNITEDSDEIIWDVTKTYWRSLNNLNAKESLDKLTIPMLILQGGKDTQVLPDKDYKGWQEALSGRQNVQFKLYENLNHNFLISKGYGFGEVLEYMGVNHVPEEVAVDIAKFIKK